MTGPGSFLSGCSAHVLLYTARVETLVIFSYGAYLGLDLPNAGAAGIGSARYSL